MKEVYAISDRHTRYFATKEFFRVTMTEGSSVQEHGVKMLSPVEKLEDLKAGLDNDMYINMILESLPPSCDLFIVNFNMNGLQKSIREASISKVKGNRARRWKRKKGKAKAKTVVVAKDAKSTPVALVGMGKGKRKMGMFVVEVNMVTNSASWVLDIGCGAHICNDLQVLHRSRKLSKDEVVLRLGDGKTVAANADEEVSGLKESKIDNLDNLPTYEFCLKGKMTRKPLLDKARGGFSYLITFTDDHSRYDYVYLMRYKFEAFVRFKEFRLEVENQIGRKIKTLWSDRGGEYLSGVTGQLDNNPKTYGEAMSDIDSGKWLEAMKIDSMSSNQVWTLMDRPKGVKPIRCKWVYKRKIGADGEVITFKARLVAKGYTQ
ncbi:Copia protein [Sesamum angolense]|uniref:Copia protein n=1 Tax=Sesamum angolense TaxID=2727404 RepID=A0AAE1T5W7_9LAMI|nr:Copia protein [Sesamum angolense]